jgi:FG-GAP-like repeat
MKQILFFIILLSAIITANGAVKTWDGGGADSNLNTAANWVNDVAPVANDDLVFPVNTVAATLNNNYFFFTTFRSVTFQGGTYTIGGNPFNVTAGITVDAGTQTLNTIIGLSGGSQTFTHGTGSVTTYAGVSLGANSLTFTGAGNGGFGLISGSGQLIKDGAGACLVLTSSGYSGAYTVNGGILVIDANTPNSNAVINGGALGGTGTIGTVTNNLGILSAGTLQSPTGIFNTKSLTFTNTTQSILAIKIGGTTAGANGYDQLNVTGTVNLANAQLAPVAWNNFRPAVNDVFTVINNDGTDAISGIFNNLPENSRISALGFAFKVSYLAGTGNDVSITRTNLAAYDFDGDGKSDVSTYRPASGTWSVKRSGNNVTTTQSFGLSSDLITPADFDGDTKTDYAVFRPSTGVWYVLKSTDNTFSAVQFGSNGDIPLPNDFDGDGKGDIAVYRPSTGVWYQFRSLDNSIYIQQFGLNGDKPVIGDYDGDGRGDIAVFRPSTNVWYYWSSLNNTFAAVLFGIANDVPIPADYDGDGKTDYAVFRASNVSGQPDFQILRSSDNVFQGVEWGSIADIPTVGDYDGDGKADYAIFRPAGNTWYLLQTTAGFSATAFGQNGDKPVESAFN